MILYLRTQANKLETPHAASRPAGVVRKGHVPLPTPANLTRRAQIGGWVREPNSLEKLRKVRLVSAPGKRMVVHARAHHVDDVRDPLLLKREVILGALDAADIEAIHDLVNARRIPGGHAPAGGMGARRRHRAGQIRKFGTAEAPAMPPQVKRYFTIRIGFL